MVYELARSKKQCADWIAGQGVNDPREGKQPIVNPGNAQESLPLKPVRVVFSFAWDIGQLSDCCI